MNFRTGALTLEDADSGGEVVDAAGSLESGGENRGGRDEIVSESVVQVALISVRQRQSHSLFLPLPLPNKLNHCCPMMDNAKGASSSRP